jgi:lipopolysaccharide exporter
MDTPEPTISGQTGAKKYQTSFTGDVIKLVSGTTIAQFLAIAASPILTRLYAPEAFGILALFVSITSILGVVACLRYELAIMLPESDEEAANLLGVSLFFTILISVLTVPAVWWGGEPLLRWLNAPELGPHLWLVPPFVFVTGLFLAFNYWNSRTKHFGRLSIARVNHSLATIAGQLGLGFAGFATGGAMISASVGGKALATAVLCGQIWRDDGKLLLRSIAWRELLSGIKRHRKFPLYSTWSALLNTISLQLPTLLLSMFFSPVVVGFYALGYRLLKLPTSLIGSAIAQVFYQRASAAQTGGTIHTVVETTFERLLKLGIFPFLLLMIIGPELFAIVFGYEWLEAGVYLQILAPWLFFVFIGSPISTLFSVLEKQEIGLFFNIALIVSRVVSLVIGGMMDDVLLALALFSISGAILWGWFCFYMISQVGLAMASLLRVFIYALLFAGLFLMPSIFFKWILSATPLLVIGICFFSTIAYYSWMIIQDNQLRQAAVKSIGKLR